MRVMKVRSLVALTICGDIFFYILSFLLAYKVCLATGMGEYSRESTIVLLIVTTVTVYVTMQIFEMYKNIFYRKKRDIVATIVLVICINSIATVMLSYLFGFKIFPRNILIMMAIFQISVLTMWRVFVWNIRKSTYHKQNILVLGEVEESMSIAKKILHKQGHIFEIKYIYNIEHGIEGVYELMNSVDHILIGSAVNKHDVEKMVLYCMTHNKNIFLIPDIFTIYLRKSNFIQIDDVPTFNLSRFGLSYEQKMIKRSIDLLVSGIGIVLSLPIMVLVAVAVKMSSSGPIFFKQLRATINNKEFHVLKFRTMINDAECNTGPVLAQAKDNRITKIGAFLRVTRLDELPQLFNVFLGSMSLIGPRPERPYFIEQFKQDVPEYVFRMHVKAGITGLAQVLGKYTTNFEDKLKYDLMYIRNYSIALDFEILLKTVKVVFTKDSSSGTGDEISLRAFMKKNEYSLVKKEFGYEMKFVKISKEEYIG